jgi:hypothetical protein
MNMAIEKRGNRWYSEVTQSYHETAEAAKFYSDREVLRRRASTPTKSEQLLEKLSPKELKELLETVSTQAEENSNSAYQEKAIAAFAERHPGVLGDTQHGVANAGAIRSWLLQRGVQHPFSLNNLETAYLALRDASAIYGDNSEVEDIESLSTEELRKRSGDYSANGGW